MGFLQEDNGNFSATRLAFLLWILGVLIGWGVASARLNKLQEIPDSVLALIGVLMTGKVTQKFAENKIPDPSQTQISGPVPAAAPALEHGSTQGNTFVKAPEPQMSIKQKLEASDL